MNHFVIDKFGRLINLEALTDNFYSDKIQMQSDFFSFLAALGQYGTHAEKKDCDCRFISFDVGTFEVIPNLGESVTLLHNTVFLVAYIRTENNFFQFFYFLFLLWKRPVLPVCLSLFQCLIIDSLSVDWKLTILSFFSRLICSKLCRFV